MKKLVISLVLGASLAIVPSAFALKAMTDSNMKDTTAQAGVSIAVDDIVLYQSVGETVYTDTDGLATNFMDSHSGDVANEASVVISGKETLTTIYAIIGAGDRGRLAHADYAAKFVEAGGVASFNGADIGFFMAKPLNIDVSNNLTMLSAGMNYNLGLLGSTNTASIAGVVIGLPTVEISKTGDTQTYGIRADNANNSECDYIQITKTDSVTAILGGYVEIAPH